MGFPRGSNIPFGQGRGQYPGREVASFINEKHRLRSGEAACTGALLALVVTLVSYGWGQNRAPVGSRFADRI